jgi:UDP-glucose:(heptosyl)LPS alpha-1,3-glucosyltransferase
LKVALVILHADPTRGGAERYTVDLAGALAARGHDVSLVSSGPVDRDDVVRGASGASYRHVELRVSGFTRAGRYRSFLRALEHYLHRRTQDWIDVAHAMLPAPGCDVYHPHAGVAAAALEKANAWFNPRRRAMANVERALVADPNGPLVICLSDYVKRFVRRYYPELPDERMVRLFNAVDLARFEPPETRTKSDWVNGLIIAQDYERKGLVEAIRATAKVPDKRLRLIVVGKQDTSSYAALAKQLGVDARVVFHPPTSKPENFYRQADFFVLPTKHDPCSLVVLEALAMGLPVISTVFNGATEVMTDGVHGLILSDPADVDALARAMTTLCDDARRCEMAEACKTLRPTLAYEHHVDELMAIYDRAIARRPQRTSATSGTSGTSGTSE